MIDTERLLLRPFRDEDLEPFVAYRADPEVARFQSWSSFDADGRRFLELIRATPPFTPGRWTQLVVERRDTGEHIGDCAVQMGGEEPQVAQLGYTFAREHQGHGFATEAARALVTHLFTARGIRRVYALTDARNGGSVRVLERLGMRREGHMVEASFHKGEWCDELLYAVLAHEWPARP